MVLLCGGLNNEAAPRALLHKVCGLRNGLCLLGCKIGCWDAEDKNGGILQQVLHVLKPGKFCILLAKQAAGTGPVQGKNAVSYPESVRQMFFSVGFCDITELETSHLRDSNKIMKQGTLFNCTSNMIGILRLLTDHALPLLLGSIFICALRACRGMCCPGVLCAVLGSRPGTPQGLDAAAATKVTGYSSTSAIALAGHGMLNMCA